ncbi:MAG: hypothetical protein QXV17_07155, partial [Candidatus Micrarchaeaceae archaeon]
STIVVQTKTYTGSGKMVDIEEVQAVKDWKRQFNVKWGIIVLLVIVIMRIFGYGIGMALWYGLTIILVVMVVRSNYKTVFPSFTKYENYDASVRWLKDMTDLRFAFYLAVNMLLFIIIFFFGVYLNNPSYFSIYMFLSLAIPFSLVIVLTARWYMGSRKENESEGEWRKARRWGIILGLMILIILPIILYLVSRVWGGGKKE